VPALTLLSADAGDTCEAHCPLDDLAAGDYADVARAQLAAMGLTPHPVLVAAVVGRGLALHVSPEQLHDLARARWRAGDMIGAASLLQVVVSSYPDYAARPPSLSLLLSQCVGEEMGSSGLGPRLDAVVAMRTDMATLPMKTGPVEDAAPVVAPRGRGIERRGSASARLGMRPPRLLECTGSKREPAPMSWRRRNVLDPRAWFDATAERMLAARQQHADLEVVGDLDAYQRDRRQRMLGWLAARPVAGLRLLEVGCGAGGNLRFLLARGARVEGADISPRMVQLARHLNADQGVDLPLHVIDGASLPHATGSFDVVLTVTALQHNHDGPQLTGLVRDIVRVLRPGGEAWIVEGVHRRGYAHRAGTLRPRAAYEAMFLDRGCLEVGYTALHSHYPTWMAMYQRWSTVSRRALLRLSRRQMPDEGDFRRRYGDGAILQSLGSRTVFALCHAADRLRRADHALAFFVFRKTT